MPDNATKAHTCRWWLERWDPYWSSDCGRAAFEFHDGGPVDNGFRFCLHCGRPLHEEQEPPHATAQSIA